MKALSKLKAEEGIWMTDVPEPEVGHNDLLIKIRKTAICGTDVHIYNWDEWSQKTIPVPMVVGHEYVGEVVGIGQEVRGFKIGDRVSGEGHITCGHCRNCRAGRTHLCRNTIGVGVNRPGCFAEYLVIPAFNAFKIPDNISDDLASIFDPFGNAVHTALSFDLVGEDVLVSGAGPIGVMGPQDVQIAIAYCGVCHSDLHQARSEWAGTLYPCVPGHEIVGRVTAVGNAVSRYAVGDLVGVGCMVDSCQQCEECA
ncbi:alcohol dehydrogenase catalytic domain-containing protein, partial [Klebsiella pneumoniae]